MKFARILGIAAALIIAITIIFVFAQPDQGRTEKSILINAPVEAVFHEVNTYRSFTEWSPWAKMDDGVKYTYEGPAVRCGRKNVLGRKKHWKRDAAD